MSSWKKVFCTLRWTVHDIDLHRPMISDYIFKWEMESDKGETDILKPNNQNQLKFDSNYERELTFYINQKDNLVRSKKLKLFLKRLNDNKKEMLYGKLIIDVAKFYQKDESTNNIIRDMESGRSVAPTFNGSFFIYPKTEDNQEIVGDNIDEPSFRIDPETDFPLSSWDISLIEDEDKNLNNNKNNEKMKNSNKKTQTLAEDAKLVKKAEEIEKKKLKHLLNIYSKNGKIPDESKAQLYSFEISEEEFEKDKETSSTASHQKEEYSQSEDFMLENDNMLTANDDDIDSALLLERKRSIEIGQNEEEEKEDFPELSITEVVKKKKKFMVIKEGSQENDDVKYRVELNQGSPGDNITRQRRVTFNFLDKSNNSEEDIIAAVKKKFAKESGKDLTNDEINAQFQLINRRSSLTYTKPGVDVNSVGAKVNLDPSKRTKLSVPTVTLNITPGVKLGTVGVQNLSIPSRDNSAATSQSTSPRSRDVADSNENSDQQNNTSPTKISKALSTIDQVPPLLPYQSTNDNSGESSKDSVPTTPIAGVTTRDLPTSPTSTVPPIVGIPKGIEIGHSTGNSSGVGIGSGVEIGNGAGFMGTQGAGAPSNVAAGAGNLPGVSIGATSVDPSAVGPSAIPGAVNSQNIQIITKPLLVTPKRMTSPSLNPQLIGTGSKQYDPALLNLQPQSYSGNTTPRSNGPNINLNQSNQQPYKNSSESGTMSEEGNSSGSQISKFPSLQASPQLHQQIQQHKLLQDQQQMQLKIPESMKSVSASHNPNFSLPSIQGLPTGTVSTSGSPSPRSLNTPTSPTASESTTGNEASDEASTASFENSPRAQTQPQNPQTNGEPIPTLNQSHQQYITRRRSSAVSVPVENLPPEIKEHIGPNKDMKNVDVEYEYEYEYDEYGGNEAKRIEEQKKEKEKLALMEKQMESNAPYCLHIVITHQWRMMSKAPKFAPDRVYPCQVFPIFATILHTQVLKSENQVRPQMRHLHQVNFDKCIQIFATDMSKMPATHGDYFLTVLLIILLIRTQGLKYKLDRKRCETALKTIQHTFESALLLILGRSLEKAEVLVELFSEANFQQQKLLSDFHEIFESNKKAFTYGEVINNFLITRFTELLEGKMLNKIISKPEKFTFGNAVKWNNFLIEFEKDNKVSMKVLRQAVNVFNMIEPIAKSPSLANEIFSDISPALISFFITHFKKDENIQNPPKPTKFNKEFKLNKAPKTFEHVPSKKTILSSDTVRKEFTLNNWNDCSPDEPNVKTFSFLANYIKSNERRSSTQGKLDIQNVT